MRVDDGRADVHVTGAVRGLRWKRSAYGGDVDATCQLVLPRGTFSDLGPGDRFVAHDARTAGVVWSGTTNHPGAVDGPGGQEFDIQALGGATRLGAVRSPLGYVVTGLTAWERSGQSVKRAQTRNDERGDGSPTLEIAADAGRPVGTSWQGEWVFRGLQDGGLEVGAVHINADAGLNDSNYRMQVRTGTNAASSVAAVSVGATTDVQRLAVTTVPAGHHTATFRAVRNSSGTTGDDNHWFRASDVVVQQRRLTQFGAPVTTGYGSLTVTTAQVIADMVGRGMIPGLDPAKVTIDPGLNFPITALDWLDGITASDALGQLAAFEPDMFWMVSGDAAVFGRWDHDNPRYVISKRHGGISLPGQDVAQANRVLVSWTDTKGKERSLAVLAEDAPAGVTGHRVVGLSVGRPDLRDAEPVTLPEGAGSPENARRAGGSVLAAANEVGAAGSAVIRVPILDQWAGCMVWPHELVPGCVVVEQETGHHHRLTEVEFFDADAAAVLTLGRPPRTTAQILARFQRTIRRRRKR